MLEQIQEIKCVQFILSSWLRRWAERENFDKVA